MQITHTPLLTAALLSAATLVAAPAAGATTQAPKPQPDLTVTKVTVARDFVVVGHNGRAAPIHVKVFLKNVGHGPAPASVTRISLVQNGHELAHEEVQAGSLARGHANVQIAVLRGVEVSLGFLRAVGRADPHIGGPGSNDQLESDPVPAIAERWRAEPMEVDVHLPGPTFGSTEDDHTAGAGSLVFTFSRLAAGPARFVYTAGGEVHENVGLSGDCTGEGENSVSMGRWGGDSGLNISKSLKDYEATVRASLAKPFTIGTTCADIPATVPLTVRYHDLLTRTSASSAPLPMNPTAHQLTNSASLGTLFTLHYDWTLNADVP